MKQKLPTLITQISEQKHIYLVFACAWCPSSTYTKLKKNEYYTHGICDDHKKVFLSEIRSRIAKMRGRADKGSRYPVASGFRQA
jgi:hypothetical protein